MIKEVCELSSVQRDQLERLSVFRSGIDRIISDVRREALIAWGSNEEAAEAISDSALALAEAIRCLLDGERALGVVA